MCQCCVNLRAKCPQNILLIVIGVAQMFIALFASCGLGLNSLISVSGEATNVQAGGLGIKVEMGISRFGFSGSYTAPNGTESSEDFYTKYDSVYSDICEANDLEDEEYCKALNLFVFISDIYVYITSLIISLLFLAGIYCIVLACAQRICCKRVKSRFINNDNAYNNTDSNNINQNNLISTNNNEDDVEMGSNIETSSNNTDNTNSTNNNTVIVNNSSDITDNSVDYHGKQASFEYQCKQCCRCMCGCISDFGICVLDLAAAVVTCLGIVIEIVCKSVNLDTLLTDITNNYYTQQAEFEMSWSNLTPGYSVPFYIIACVIALIMFVYLLLSILLTFCCQCCECCNYCFCVPRLDSHQRRENMENERAGSEYRRMTEDM